MGFTEDIVKLSEQVRKRFDALGYDVYDPSEVMPEYVADFATRRAGQFEKVDYALAINGTKVMLVEAKARGQKAEAHDGQLSKYFNALLTTKVAIVTNGIEYRFFTDLRDKMSWTRSHFLLSTSLNMIPKILITSNFFIVIILRLQLLPTMLKKWFM